MRALGNLLKALIFCATFAIGSTVILQAEDDSLVVAFQKQKDPAQLKDDASRLANAISAKVHLPVEARVPSDYQSVVQALVSRTADVAYLDSFSYLLARRDGGAELLLAEERPDATGKPRTEYDSIIVVPKTSSLRTFGDLVKEAKNLRIAFTSPTSTSGYVFPYRRFVEAGLLKAGDDIKSVFKEAHFAGSYGQALEAIVQGNADVAAVSFYALEGSSASKHISPDKAQKLRVLERIPGVPTHVVAVRSGLPEDLKSELKLALLQIGDQHPELFKDVYGAANFIEVDPVQHVKASEEAVKSLGVPLESIAGR